MTKPNAKHIAMLFAATLLATATPATGQTSAGKAREIFQCYNPGNRTAPIVRVWSHGETTLTLGDDGKIDFDRSVSVDVGVEMNGIARKAGYTTGMGFDRMWYIPSFRVKNDGSGNPVSEKSFDTFIIEGNGVGIYEQQGEESFRVSCERK